MPIDIMWMVLTVTFFDQTSATIYMRKPLLHNGILR